MAASGIVAALLPDIVVIVLGFFIRHQFSVEFWHTLNRLCYYVFFPCLILTATLSRPIDTAQLALFSATIGLVMVCGLLLSWPLRRLGPERYIDFAGVWQTAWRFNSGLAFVAAQALPPQAQVLMALAVGLGVPVGNVLAVAALARGNKSSLGFTLGSIVSNPLFLASCVGIAVNASGIAVPEIPMQTFSRLGDATLPLILLTIGASLNGQAMVRMNRFAVGMHTIKLIVLPALTLLIAYMAEFDASVTAVLVVFAALPSSTAAQTLAVSFGADRQVTATVIVQSTVLACLTLPVWIGWVG